MRQSILGVPWFASQHDFQQLLLVLDGAENITPDYSEWLMRAQSFEKARLAQGVRVVRAEMKFPDFINWCAAKGVKANSRARTLFADEAVAKVRESERAMAAIVDLTPKSDPWSVAQQSF